MDCGWSRRQEDGVEMKGKMKKLAHGHGEAL